MTALQIGGCDDHVHALVQAPPIYSPREIAQYLKGQSSKWIHEEFPALRDFGWQDGYQERRSTLSFAFAASIVCHCIFEGLSAPPLVSGRTWSIT